ncbi:MAG TPA: SOUL heme-binding protein [Opitutae bacterium]|nr:SOUL heme-binding protein [Opitutae bacterium]
MKVKTVTIWFVAAALIVGGSILTVGLRASTESARYKVLEKSGKIEIRQYAEHLVAATSISGAGGNGSFGRLFRYISGENKDSKKIAMTTPVFMPATPNGRTTEMQFVVPVDVAQSGAPAPSSKSVSLKRMPSGRYAAIRYGGRSNAKVQKERLAELRAYLAEEGLEPVGNPLFAGYDPPWTPAPLRRNEVLLRLR